MKVIDLYSNGQNSYLRLIKFLAYPQDIYRYFLHCSYLAPNLKVLDAGCGTGVSTLALRDALVERGMVLGEMHGFDLTPAMLESFSTTIKEKNIDNISLLKANALELETLPKDWNGYDLIISSSMFEYLPPERLAETIQKLRALLKPNGKFILIITRKNWLTRFYVGKLWQANLYKKEDLINIFHQTDFTTINFAAFPFRLNLWSFVIEAGG